MTMKLHKWGVKVWTQHDVSGMLYHFTVNIGNKLDTFIAREYGKIGAVVLKLIKNFHQFFIQHY